jgi:hypothetical protein
MRLKTVGQTMNTAVQEPQGQKSLETAIFKLKLQWMMAKDDNEKNRLSEEIRRRIGSASA